MPRADPITLTRAASHFDPRIKHSRPDLSRSRGRGFVAHTSIAPPRSPFATASARLSRSRGRGFLAHTSIAPPRSPFATASARLVASSLANSASRWNFTVCTEMPNLRATALLVSP